MSRDSSGEAFHAFNNFGISLKRGAMTSYRSFSLQILRVALNIDRRCDDGATLYRVVKILYVTLAAFGKSGTLDRLERTVVMCFERSFEAKRICINKLCAGS